MRRTRAILGLAALVVAVAALVALRLPRGPEPIPVAAPIVVSTAYVRDADQLGRNETLSHLMARHNIFGADLLDLVAAAQHGGLDPRRVRPSLVFEFRRDATDSVPDLIRTRIADDAYLTLERDGTGAWSGQRVPIEWLSTVDRVEGIISSSLNAAIHEAIPDTVLSFGERDRLIWNTAEAVYGWVIDFTRDLRPGDGYRVVYERLVSSEGDVRYGRVLAADVEVQGRSHTAYRLPGRDGKDQYYDADRRSLHRAFLKYPVQFRRISSGFTGRRFHPVLKIHRAHLGYDFAADVGTPIRATGDGTIVRAGRNGGYGLMVAIRHPKGIETRYAHMSRIAKGMRRGIRVTQGQTIGYVGMTGLANGPHVHYEFLKNGRQINYRTVDLGDGEMLPGALVSAFEDVRSRFDRVLYSGAIPPVKAGGAP